VFSEETSSSLSTALDTIVFEANLYVTSVEGRNDEAFARRASMPYLNRNVGR
jgi:hypothetical protein